MADMVDNDLEKASIKYLVLNPAVFVNSVNYPKPCYAIRYLENHTRQDKRDSYFIPCFILRRWQISIIAILRYLVLY